MIKAYSKVTTKFANWFDCISEMDQTEVGKTGKLVSYIILPFIAFFQLNVHLTLHLCILIQQKYNSFGLYLIMKKKSRFLSLICHLHVDLCFIVKSLSGLILKCTCMIVKYMCIYIIMQT